MSTTVKVDEAVIVTPAPDPVPSSTTPPPVSTEKKKATPKRRSKKKGMNRRWWWILAALLIAVVFFWGFIGLVTSPAVQTAFNNWVAKPVARSFGAVEVLPSEDSEELAARNAQLGGGSGGFASETGVNTQVAQASTFAATSDGTQVTLPADVTQQLTLLGYGSFQDFATKWGLKIGMDKANAEVDPRELTICPYEVNGCVRILREKDEYNNIIPFYISVNNQCWHDGWRREKGQVRPGGYTIPERSGIPPQFSGLVEGITVRACKQTGTSGTLPGEAQSSSNGVSVVPTVVPVGNTGNGVVVQTDNLNVRSEPRIDAPVVGNPLRLGAIVPDLGHSGSWIKIGEGQWIAGWLTSANLPYPQESQAQPSNQSQPLPTVDPQASVAGGMGGTSDLSQYGVKILEGSPNLQPCADNASALCWSDPSHPALIEFSVPQDGEYYTTPGAKTGAVGYGIPVGKWYVNAGTLYIGGVSR